MYGEVLRKYFKFCGFVFLIMGIIVLMLGMTAMMVEYGENMQYLVYVGIPFLLVGIVVIVVTGMLKPGYVTKKQKKANKEKAKIAKNSSSNN